METFLRESNRRNATSQKNFKSQGWTGGYNVLEDTLNVNCIYHKTEKEVNNRNLTDNSV
jgi:hypothetical protein